MATSLVSPMHLLSLILLYVAVTSSGQPISGNDIEYRTGDITDGATDKRASLSVSQELNSLADNYREKNRMQQMKHAENLLMSLGKRVPQMSVNQHLQSLADEYAKNRMQGAQASLYSLGKRSDGDMRKRMPVSINQELGPLSSLMHKQGAANAQNLLASLGKRSDLGDGLYLTGDLDQAALRDLANDLIGADTADVKRASLSIGQELRPLSQLVGGERHATRTMNFLQSLGKRSAADEGQVPVVKRSHLSVSVPLNTLSNLLSAEQRRQYSLRSAQKLSALG